MPSTEDIIRTTGVSKNFHNHLALQDVSINVPTGSIFGLLGPNGAGKTTLIRILNHITAPDTGEVYFNNHKLNPEDVSSIGYLPEERGLYKKMGVGEQAIYLAQLRGLSKREAKRKLQEWFEKFEMTGWWKKKVADLSKGMQQKVQFIITLIHEPKLLILDEPFSGFDPINTEQIKKEILSLKENGTTIVLSTHNMNSVEELCDHIALLHNSRKILDGPVNKVREENKDNTYKIEFSGNLIGFTNALWAGAEIIEKNTEKELVTVKVKLLGQTNANQLLQAVLPHVNIKSFNEILPSMNDVFIRKVSGTQDTIAEENDTPNVTETDG